MNFIWRRVSRAANWTLWRQNDGSVAVLFALLFTVMAGCVALALDGGRLFVTRRVDQNSMDSAADGGTWTLMTAWNNGATASASQVQAVALDYAQRNHPGSVTPVLRYINSDVKTTTTAPGGSTRGVVASVDETVPMTFAAVLGLSQVQVGAHGAAIFGVATGLYSVVPWGVNDDSFSGFGTVVGLQPAQGSSNYGNFNFASIVPPGCSAGDLNCYTDAVANGTKQPIYLNGTSGAPGGGYPVNSFDMSALSSTSGNALRARMDSAPNETCSSFAPGSRRVIFLPIINGDVGGSTARFIRFRAFFLTKIDVPKGASGCFVKTSVGSGEVVIDPGASAASYGGVVGMKSIPWP